MSLRGLDFQNVEVRFTGGLDTKTHPKLVIQSKWRQLKNVTLTADGTPRRRDGWAQLDAAAVGNGLATHNQQLLTVNAGAVRSMSSALSATVPVPGTLGYVGVAKSDVYRGVGNQDMPDCATGNGYTCFVWRTVLAASTSVKYSLLDENTGAYVVFNADVKAVAGATFLTGAMHPRVVFAANAFWIFYLEGAPLATPTLFCRIVETSAPTVLGADTAILTNVSLGVIAMDACAFSINGPLSGQVMVVYGWVDNVGAFAPASGAGLKSCLTSPVTRTGNVPNAIVTQTAVTLSGPLPFANITAMTCVAFSANAAAGFVMGSGTPGVVQGTTIDSTWAQVVAGATIDAPATVSASALPTFSHLTATVVGNTYRVFYDQMSAWGTVAALPLTQNTCNAALVSTAITTLVVQATYNEGTANTPIGPQGPFIWGKAFSDGITVFLPTAVLQNYDAPGAWTNTNSTQNGLFVYDCDARVVVARALYGSFGVAIGVGSGPRTGSPTSVVLTANGWALPCSEYGFFQFNATTPLGQSRNSTPIGLCRITLAVNRSTSPRHAQLGPGTLWAVGSPTRFDGGQVTEEGFALFPEGISALAVAGAGANTAGVHQIVVVYEWVDDAGQRHQSAPSLPVATTLLAGGHCNVIAPTLRLTQKTDVLAVVYMTQAAGLTMTRVPGGSVANDPTVATVTIVVASADANIAGAELLYTQPLISGSALANDAPSPCGVCDVHQSRIFVDVADDPGAFRFSQPLTQGVGLQWSRYLGGRVPVEARPPGIPAITGIVTQDEKVFLFTFRRVYVVFGTGPNAAGGYGNYSDPVEIPGDVGCAYPESIVNGPAGVIFKSLKGWHLLTRDLQVRYIGEAVNAYDAQGVTSAVLLADRKEARFTTTGEGLHLVYSYLYDQWSVFQSGVAYPIFDAIWWPTTERYVHINKTTGLCTDTPGVTADNQTGTPQPISTLMQTAWVKLATIAGFQRIRWLYLTGTAATAVAPIASTFIIQVNYDYGDNQVAPGAYTVTQALSTLTFVAGMPIDIRHKLHRQKCEAVSFIFAETTGKWDDVQLTGLQGMVLHVGVKRGTNKLPAAQSFG